MTRSLAQNPKNKLKHIRCPDCGSTNWRRTDVSKPFKCQKCATEWKEGDEKRGL